MFVSPVHEIGSPYDSDLNSRVACHPRLRGFHIVIVKAPCYNCERARNNRAHTMATAEQVTHAPSLKHKYFTILHYYCYINILFKLLPGEGGN